MKTVYALLAFALAGPAIADSIVKPNPTHITATAPGNIRTETCSRPEYPVEELNEKYEGTVTLLFLIDVNGVVKQSKIHTSSGYQALDKAALTAISKCRFNPPLVNNQPVEGWTSIQYAWTQKSK